MAGGKPIGERITSGDIVRDFKPSPLKRGKVKGKKNFPISVATVKRVDPKRMVVDLLAYDEVMPRKNVPISFPGAGGRHFLGAMPQVGDVCVIGSQPAESGRNSAPVILGWFVPGSQAALEWLTVRSHSPNELGLIPKEKVALEGSASERRYKFRQMEEGHVVASSAQGSDLVLTESATLTNRRGNEIILRDQDQALVIRSLQQFMAGAGFRVYGGMVQRDSSLLPTQMFKDSIDWSGDQQVDGDGTPLLPSQMGNVPDAGTINPSYVFNMGEDGTNNANGLDFTTETNPIDILQRGLFISADGTVFDDKVKRGVTYGGKPMFRVSKDSRNGVDNAGADIYSEYRIEVSHTTDGVLPVTEQTDGLDVDRLLPNSPNPDLPSDPNNRSSSSPMVEFVLGTVVGNDSTNERDSYGSPLVAKIVNKNGRKQTIIRASTPDDSTEDQLAFMIRVRNPEKPTVEPSFIAITKGGAYLNNFQGHGSKVVQEDYRTGKQSFYGVDADGQSFSNECEGSVSLKNTGSGRGVDNVGVEITADRAAVIISAGGSITEGAAGSSASPNSSPASQNIAMKLQSATGTLIQATNKVLVQAPEISLSEAKSINVTSNGTIDLNSGDTTSVTTKVLSVSVAGSAEYVFGGPKDGVPTNGPSRLTTFSASPLTGSTGGMTDNYLMRFGGRSETINVGSYSNLVNAGSISISATTVDVASQVAGIDWGLGVGIGVSVSSGPPFLNNYLDITPLNTQLSAGVGNVSVSANKGMVTVSGIAVNVNASAGINLSSSVVSISGGVGPVGGMINQGCLDGLTGRPFFLSGTIGIPSIMKL
jgi:hypothetical protein